MSRLSRSTLERLPATVARPGYQPEAHACGIVHLGLGAFHRAHQAAYTDEVLNRYGGDWRITGVSLRSAQVQAQLAPQDGLYTLTQRDGAGQHTRLIASIAEVLVAPQQAEAVIDAIAHPQTRIVTLTITEKAYDAADLGDAARSPAASPNAIARLVQGLARRHQRGGSGLSLMSCDNLAANGRRLEAAVLEQCQTHPGGLAEWVTNHCRFPSSMVDRMVPATTRTDRDALALRLGLHDEAAVFTEPYCQWVIEDRFAGPVPPWDRVGVEIVSDVAPYEAMKLRLLNASHSAIAYIGLLLGYATVAAAVSDQRLLEFVARLMRVEAAPTLALPAEYPLAAYRAGLLQRFANPALGHRTVQIAADGSTKLPQRVLPVMRWNLEHGGAVDGTSLIVAAWLVCITGADPHGHSRAIDDPQAATLRRIRREGGAAAFLQMLHVESIFGTLFVEHPRAAERVVGGCELIERQGVGAALEACRHGRAD